MRLLLASISIFIISSVSAQIIQPPCIEEHRIQPYFQCFDQFFNPVCGCDNKTYRNDCVSFNRYGVTFVQSAGVCPNDYMFFDFYPNLVTYELNFFMQFVQNEMGSGSIEIRDAYGKQMHFQLITRRNYYSETMYLDYLEPGVYWMVVRIGDAAQSKMFVKINN